MRLVGVLWQFQHADGHTDTCCTNNRMPRNADRLSSPSPSTLHFPDFQRPATYRVYWKTNAQSDNAHCLSAVGNSSAYWVSTESKTNNCKPWGWLPDGVLWQFQHKQAVLCHYDIITIINVLIKVTLNEIRCRGTLQSQWSDANSEYESIYKSWRECQCHRWEQV